ncbi:hypothetical protein D3C84_1169920 [compost metagenome]
MQLHLVMACLKVKQEELLKLLQIQLQFAHKILQIFQLPVKKRRVNSCKKTIFIHLKIKAN